MRLKKQKASNEKGGYVATGQKMYPVNPTDENLMERFKAGSEDSFKELYERYMYLRKVNLYAYRVLGDCALGEEAVHEAFLKIIKNKRKFDPAKAKFSTWFYTILTRWRWNIL